jgi:tRNA modification GTPase
LIDSERQHGLLRRAAGALRVVQDALAGGISLDLVALDLQDAVAALGEITGEVSSHELLETMFSNFCVGK